MFKNAAMRCCHSHSAKERIKSTRRSPKRLWRLMPTLNRKAGSLLLYSKTHQNQVLRQKQVGSDKVVVTENTRVFDIDVIKWTRIYLFFRIGFISQCPLLLAQYNESNDLSTFLCLANNTICQTIQNPFLFSIPLFHLTQNAIFIMKKDFFLLQM